MFKVFIIASDSSRYELDEFHPAADLAQAHVHADDLEAAYLKWEADGFPRGDGVREDVQHCEGCSVCCEDLTTGEQFVLTDQGWEHE